MDPILTGSLTALLALAAPGFIQAQEAASALAIENVSLVIPSSDRIRRNQTVLIQGDRITGVHPAGAATLPEGARRIDGRGRFLMAGLVDMHVHLNDPRDGLLYVASGVTSIRNLSGQPFHLDLDAAYQRGRWIGPTLKSSGPQVRLAGNTSTEQAQGVIRDHQAAGYASVKLYGQTSHENYATMAAASEELGMPIVGHIPRNMTLEDIVELGGLREISHTEELLYAFINRHRGPRQELLEECIGLLAESGAYVTPTISVYAEIAPQVTDLEAVLSRPSMRLLPPLAHIMFGPGQNKYRSFGEGSLDSIARGTEAILALTGMMAEAGVPLLLGTDAMNPAVIPGVSIVDELVRMVEAGLTPAQALAAGTSTPAEFWHESEEFGRIASGLRADLVLLAENPLEDVRRVGRPEAVVLRGQWLSRAELDQRLEQQVAGYATERGPLARLEKSNPSACLAAVEELESAPPEAFFLSLISVYHLLQNLDGVLQIVELGLGTYPQSELLVNCLAEAQALAGDLDSARESYHYALEINPENAVALRGLANLKR